MKPKSIEVVMDSGLGNEMFQYAIGRAFSIRLGYPLVLDISLRFQAPAPGFNLPCFKLGTHRVRELPYALWLGRRTALRLLASCGLELVSFVEEPSLLYWKEVLEVRAPCILTGFWQSERYFESISDQLRQEFVIIREQDQRSADCQRRIQAGHSVGLHVRRKDYLPAPGEEDYHGTCPKEYYDAALKLIRARMPTTVELFVFSDDIPWARENIRYDLPTEYIDWNSERNYEDLRLMSHCKAIIIANSTFSWWAGWLNSRQDKIVVAPRRWYLAPGVESDLPNSPWIIAI